MKEPERHSDVDARIRAAAEELFSSKGYAETKISDIASRAGVSPSAIYLYYSGKRQLFSSLNIPEAAQKRPEFDRKRQEIVRTALSVFGEQGFEGTTMDEIAARLGFSKAALYQYCSGKEDLFLQVLQAYTHASPPAAVMDGISAANWREGIRRIAESYMEVSHDQNRTAFLGSVMRDSNQFPSFGSAYYEKSFLFACTNMREFLTPLQDAGLLRNDVDLDSAVRVFFGSLTAHIVLHGVVKGIDDHPDEEQYIATLCDIFIRGIESNENNPLTTTG